GEPLRPLKDIASGGEMSRIMLAIKTVLASGGGIDTLIFDEIDAGISGRTAQAVSEKLGAVASNHQVICITHLPQIAAMADTHFLIEKSVENGHTISGIKKLLGDETVDELARMLGGSAITEAVMTNAKEMKDLARSYKERA
ncbi:MAG: DNA repair protein RecN, partial [Pseudobutyrivibrio sp.]|nr:DNA repair protein RecN [Pseudobutyrivibrio sp.]